MGLPSVDELVECYAMSDDGLDFKAVAQERREVARQAIAALAGDPAQKISTVDELIELPLGSVVIDDRGVARMNRAGNSHMPGGWTQGGNSPLTTHELADGRPMTVAYRAPRRCVLTVTDTTTGAK